MMKWFLRRVPRPFKEERTVFSTHGAGHVKFHKQKKEVRLLHYTKYKLELKWINDLDIKAKTVKLLKENTKEKLNGNGFDNDFLEQKRSIGNK